VSSLELWGGVECTVNRVGDTWFSQLERNGHLVREEDLDRIAALGIRRMRYPVLWELTAPDCPESPDWRWADRRLTRMRELGIEPIVGLVHHGSGPRYTSLVHENFPEQLAHYAHQVASRFPWLQWYTPVNEPLTTARFSGLYGIWYPHGRNEETFVRALLNQCRATALAMLAIRRVNPHARLIQTEDLGRTFATPQMQYQADFNNERRWLSWDLLCGRVDDLHALRQFLLDAHATRAELDWFCANPCPPDLLGLNHYVTSDRFLDERLESYPQGAWGSNGRARYADVEAVRVLRPPLESWRVALRDAWQRYELPIAITEAHLGCSSDEQVRWLHEAWRAAREASLQGLDVRAVTSWALFGSFDWDTLLTKGDSHYEPGAFDVRTSPPRATAVAAAICHLAKGREQPHSVTKDPGWWRRPERLLYPPISAASSSRAQT
jgi:dTDP-4-dehydrorhamnose reductase